MSMKIKISYTDPVEEQAVMNLLKPLLNWFKVKKSDGTPPYKHVYLTPMKKPQG